MITNNSYFVTENIPVELSFSLRFKESVHNFFRRPIIVKIFSLLPPFLFGKQKELAMLISKCHKTFAESSQYTNQMQVKIYGGDKLSTLQELEEKIKKNKTDQQSDTIIRFSINNSLDAAHIMRQNLENQDERIGILNLAN